MSVVTFSHFADDLKTGTQVTIPTSDMRALCVAFSFNKFGRGPQRKLGLRESMDLRTASAFRCAIVDAMSASGTERPTPSGL